MTEPVIAMIGAGNMGSSLIGGIIRNGHSPEKIIASDHDEGKLIALEATHGIYTTLDNSTAISKADVIIFAIKPQHFAGAAKALRPEVQTRKPLVLSIAAGVRETSIQSWLGGNISIVRAMPNTPALIGCGATALYANQYVNAAQKKLAESLMQSVGLVVWVKEESAMDTVTALSGSGPAYFFLVMEAMLATAEQLGLKPETAKQLILQTALGSARMAIESGKSLEELRHSVTSKGGTTEKAISVLEEHNIRDIFNKALHGAKRRSEELAEIVHKEH